MRREFWGFRPWRRHDLILAVGGTMYTLVGISYVLAKPSPNRDVSLAVLLSIFPFHVWGWIWVVAGLVALISSRWPPFAETWGYVVLTAMAVGWGSSYLLGILLGPSPWTNINGFFVWALLGFMWWAISGLLNPDRTGVTNASSRPS